MYTDDACVVIDMEIGDQRDSLYLSTQGKGTQATYYSSLALTLKLVGASA